jgi:predicted nuclease of predicted toxin-antitoxin system
MDHHVRSVVTLGLRRRGVDVLTAEEDGASRLSDTELLTRASTLGRVLFTQDEDFLTEGAARMDRGESGSDASEWAGAITYLPL